jgi:hypothetical protein
MLPILASLVAILLPLVANNAASKECLIRGGLQILLLS